MQAESPLYISLFAGLWTGRGPLSYRV